MNKTGLTFPKPTPQKFSLEKLQNAYVTTLEELIKMLSEVITLLCSEDIIEGSSISQLNQLHSQLKYQEKMRNETEGRHHRLNQTVQEAIFALKAKNQEFPKIKQMKSQHGGELSTIAEKYSQENLLANYIRKNSNPNSYRQKNYSPFERRSETINVSEVVFREDTRKSLDTPNSLQKKPLYKQLERIKTKDAMLYGDKYQHPDHHQADSKKYNLKSKLPYFHLNKLI